MWWGTSSGRGTSQDLSTIYSAGYRSLYFLAKSSFQDSFDSSSGRRRGRVPRLSSLVVYELFAHRHPKRSGTGPESPHIGWCQQSPWPSRRIAVRDAGCERVATSTALPMRAALQFWKLPKCPPDTLPNRPGILLEGMPLGRPNEPGNPPGAGRSASHSGGARPIASSQAATTSSPEAGTG